MSGTASSVDMETAGFAPPAMAVGETPRAPRQPCGPRRVGVGWHGAVLAASSLLGVGTAQAQGFAPASVIAEISIDKAVGSIVFIRLSPQPGSPAACSTNGYWSFTLPLTADADHKTYAALLTAFASDTIVAMRGTGLCSEFGSIESLRVFSIKR